MSLSCTVWLQWGLQEVPLCHKIVIREENKSIHVQQQQQPAAGPCWADKDKLTELENQM